MATAATGLWPLEKYARLVPDIDKEALPQAGGTSKKGGTWIHYSSTKDSGLQLALLDSNHFMVSSGTQIYESFSLWDAHKWIKGVSKGDSILFIYQLKEESRRFRVKFSSQPPSTTPLEACNDCISKLSPLLPIKQMSTLSSSASSSSQTGTVTQSQLPLEDSQMFSQVQEPYQDTEPVRMQTGLETQGSSGENPMDSDLMSVSELAKEIVTGGKNLGKAYSDTNFPVGQLGDFIRLCLTDSSFPAFVGEVEKELNKITN